MTAVVVALAACSSSPPTTGTSQDAPPIASESPQVQAQFDEAYKYFETGDWDQALAEFKLLQAEHEGDPTADLAELYIARSLLGDLDRRFDDDEGTQSPPIDREVYALLEPLSTSESVDSRIRYAAMGYLAVARAVDGDVNDAVEQLGDYPGASISPAVLHRDHRWTWPLIAEGLAVNERHGEAVVAWGKLYHLLRQEAVAERPESSDDEQWMGDLKLPAAAELAVSRAFEAQRFLSDDDVRRFIQHEQPLVRAVGAWTLIRAELEQTPDAQRVEVLQDIFNETSSDFLMVNAADRASELSIALAAVSGPERLVIGALVPLSGPNRAVGYRALAGMLIGQQAFHAAGEPSVTLVIEDSYPDVEAAYERLAAEGVLAVVGPMQTTEARQLLELASRRGVPVMALAADRIRDQESYRELSPAVQRSPEADADDTELDHDDEVAPVFRNFVDAVAEARAAAQLSFERFGDRRAAVVHPDMGYGRVLASAFIDEFRRQGGEIVAEVEYDRSATDYVSTARTVARSNPDAIFLPDTGAKVAELSAFFAQEDIWGAHPDEARSESRRTYVHYLGTSLWQDPIILSQAASYLEGALIPAWYSPVFEEPETRQLSRGFEAIYGSQPDHFAAFAYDSVARLRMYLLERGVPDSAGITDMLRQKQWEDGATGRHHFGVDGEPRRQLRYLVVEDGQWSVYDAVVSTPLEGRREAEQDLDGDEPLEALDEGAVDEVDTDAPDGL